MKIVAYSLSLRNHMVARVLGCFVSIAFALQPLHLFAASDYYRHVIFDNSITHDTYYFSRGQANGQSFVEESDNRLPVESTTFRTPPNAIRVQWQSAPEGSWTAQISVLDFRNRRPGLDGHNLYFWIYAPRPISAADMPQLTLSTSSEGLQVAEFPASFSTPIALANTPAMCVEASGSKCAFRSLKLPRPQSIPSAPNTFRASPFIRECPTTSATR